jgi:hypothetical protein
LATEIHCLLHGTKTLLRSLNDVDFAAGSFGSIPLTLAGDFLFRHVHPFDPPGKTLMKLVDAQAALRIDIFRAAGGTVRRSQAIDFLGQPMRLIPLEDLLARTARLTLDLAAGSPIPAKYARDFERLSGLVQSCRAAIPADYP